MGTTGLEPWLSTFLGQGSLWKSDKSYKIIIPEDTAHIQNFKGGGSFMGHWLRTSALNLTSSSARSCQLLLPLISLPLGSRVSEKFPRDANSLQPSSSISTLRAPWGRGRMFAFCMLRISILCVSANAQYAGHIATSQHSCTSTFILSASFMEHLFTESHTTQQVWAPAGLLKYRRSYQK